MAPDFLIQEVIPFNKNNKCFIRRQVVVEVPAYQGIPFGCSFVVGRVCLLIDLSDAQFDIPVLLGKGGMRGTFAPSSSSAPPLREISKILKVCRWKR